jgi:hypothetical protein
MYTPDEWVLVKVNGTDPHYRVFGSWLGDYLNGDSWRLNSGIVRAEQDGDSYIFYGASGSAYICHKDSYGVKSMYNSAVLENLCDNNMDILSKCPDVPNFNWIIL